MRELANKSNVVRIDDPVSVEVLKDAGINDGRGRDLLCLQIVLLTDVHVRLAGLHGFWILPLPL